MSKSNQHERISPEGEPILARLLNKSDAARILDVSEKTLDNWVSNRAVDLPYVKVGKCRKYRESDIEQFINKNLHRPKSITANRQSENPAD